jgi:hypothetical protein
MKLITMITLLLTDADVVMTLLGCYAFAMLGYYALLYIIGAFGVTYMGGALCSHLYSYRMVSLFRDKVASGLVEGITLNDVKDMKTEQQFYDFCRKESTNPPRKSCLYIFYAERRRFGRSLVKPQHSIPFLRMMAFAWQSSIMPNDFAGLLNANGLWSFTAGIAMQASSLFFVATEGFDIYVAASLAVGVATTVMSFLNIILDFPGQLAAIEQAATEKAQLLIEAEGAIKESFEALEQQKKDEKDTIFGDIHEGIKVNPVKAVEKYNAKTREINDAKESLLTAQLADVKHTYDIKKRAYESLMSKEYGGHGGSQD